MAVRSVTKAEQAEPGLDSKTFESVIESLVLKGDVSELTGEERALYYIYLCESLGLNPSTQPIEFIQLNGKLVPYVRRNGTDQLAKIHRLNREIIDGPKVMDLAGAKLIYAVCRATLPNGRTETAVATLPLQDHANVMMKCETKAKRRATLSILGLGMLDEMELETIPAHVKAAPESPANETHVEYEVPPALEPVQDAIDQLLTTDRDGVVEPLLLEQAATIYLDHEASLGQEDRAAAFALLHKNCLEGTSLGSLKREIAVQRIESDYQKARSLDEVIAINTDVAEKTPHLKFPKGSPLPARIEAARVKAVARLTPPDGPKGTDKPANDSVTSVTPMTPVTPGVDRDAKAWLDRLSMERDAESVALLYASCQRLFERTGVDDARRRATVDVLCTRLGTDSKNQAVNFLRSTLRRQGGRRGMASVLYPAKVG